MAQLISPRFVTGVPATVIVEPTPASWRIDEQQRFVSAALRLDRQVRVSEAWALRDEFLSLRTEEEFLAVLNRIGRFVWRGRSEAWRLADLQSFQQAFRAMLRQPAKWASAGDRLRDIAPSVADVLSQAPRYEVDFLLGGEDPRVYLIARDAYSAILGTVLLDALRGARYAFCARQDCGKVYEITSGHQRKYCGQYCAHLESVRRLRLRKRLGKNRRNDSDSAVPEADSE